MPLGIRGEPGSDVGAQRSKWRFCLLGSGMRISLQQWAQLDSGRSESRIERSWLPCMSGDESPQRHRLTRQRGLFGASHPWCIGESCLDGGFGHHVLGAILP